METLNEFAQIYSLHFFLLFIGLAIVTLIRQRIQKVCTLPPGPRPWPVIGNLHQLKLPPHKTMCQLSRTYGPVMCLHFGSVTAIVISSLEKAKDFLKYNDMAFASRPPSYFGKHMTYHHSDMIFAPYGQYWRQARKICVLELLTAKRVESFNSLRRSEVEIMLENIWKKSEQGTVAVDLSEATASLTTNIMWRIICGRKYAGNELIGRDMTFKKFTAELSEVAGKFFIGDFIPWLSWLDIQGVKSKVKNLHLAYDVMAEQLIKGRLKDKPTGSDKLQDFLDILLHLHGENPNEFTMQTVKALMFDMAMAGIETSATVMEWAMSLILKHPHVLKKMQKEIRGLVGKDVNVEEEDAKKLKYLDCVVKETMRMYPPLPLSLPHSSVEESEVCGYRVEKGSIVFLNLWAIGRDPSVWDEPDEFKPERFMEDENGCDMRSIPFSGGRRGCPGALMALPILHFTLASLVQRFDWKVEDEIDMKEPLVGVTIPRHSPLFAIPLSMG